ncbi:hypothetical protein GGR52DRAFT_82480 [Hypoxylon sp. FL1284]|nr:hypothetical protein GGR52DRAFT_82480 [Hypoxylon sp. FL1284]
MRYLPIDGRLDGRSIRVRERGKEIQINVAVCVCVSLVFLLPLTTLARPYPPLRPRYLLAVGWRLDRGGTEGGRGCLSHPHIEALWRDVGRLSGRSALRADGFFRSHAPPNHISRVCQKRDMSSWVTGKSRDQNNEPSYLVLGGKKCFVSSSSSCMYVPPSLASYAA